MEGNSHIKKKNISDADNDLACQTPETAKWQRTK